MGTPESLNKLQIDSDPHSVLWACFVAPFLDGSEPRMARVSLGPTTDLEHLVPATATIRTIDGDGHRAMLGETPAWTVLAQANSGGQRLGARPRCDR